MGGDPGQEFDEFFLEVFPRARSLALRLLGSAQDAEDAAAEACVRALVRWRSIGPLPHREAWVLRTTANVAIDMVRRRRVVPGSESAVPDADEAVVLRLTLIEALRALPARQRQVVVLRHLAGVPEGEVAASLGMSRNTVKKHLQRGMNRLRAGLGQEGQGVRFV